MKISPDAVKELQGLLEQEYGEEVSLFEAEKTAQNLLNVFMICLKK